MVKLHDPARDYPSLQDLQMIQMNSDSDIYIYILTSKAFGPSSLRFQEAPTRHAPVHARARSSLQRASTRRKLQATHAKRQMQRNMATKHIKASAAGSNRQQPGQSSKFMWKSVGCGTGGGLDGSSVETWGTMPTNLQHPATIGLVLHHHSAVIL